jgi:uncharacterized protein YeaO (DUF488 family)
MLAVSPRSWEKRVDITSRRLEEGPHASDGMRVLVDRLWPNGLRPKTARIDSGWKALVPSDTP